MIKNFNAEQENLILEIKKVILANKNYEEVYELKTIYKLITKFEKNLNKTFCDRCGVKMIRFEKDGVKGFICPICHDKYIEGECQNEDES